MAITKRRKPYLWVTWLAAALAGDKMCEYAFWLKANFKFDKLKEEADREAELAKWKADHAEVVRRRADALRAEGYDVAIEGENKFTVYGKFADVGGAMDIVATKGDVVRVEDVKTGKKKPEHYWQVLIYLVMLPKTKAKFMSPNAELVGAIVYEDEVREISGPEAAAEASRVFGRVVDLATKDEPAKSPGNDCRFCDVADCDARVGDDAERIDTEDF